MLGLDLEQYKDDSVDIDRDNLNGEFCRVGTDYAFWAEKFADAEGALVKAKAEVERARSRADADIRAALFARGEKITETKVESLVETSADVMKAVDALAECTKLRTWLRGILDAISTKRDMLVSLGAMIRAERQSDPSLFG